jgi:hypothetical protein
MLRLTVAVLAVVAAVALADPPRPNISERFLAAVDVESHERDRAVFGDGFLAHDQSAQRGAERYDLRPEHYHVVHVLNLQRGDLHREFAISSEDMRDCHVRDIDTVEPPFGWVSQAHYIGNATHHERTLDGWEARFGGVRLLLGVAPEDPNRPVIFERESTGEYSRFYFREFNVTTPDSKFFNVPTECRT